ncbi:hypothetical protein [Halomicronema sp. CCY15110]|uniref:hypothetical protein n=1 Tax=Halomicronema sp. CCY15110 TaxID=2767773 RepID=UPI00194EB5F2|nr:hypothetical protein [Halomicronema sp. CCY15110]
MRLTQRSPQLTPSPPRWSRDLAEIWGIQNIVIEQLSPQVLGEQLQLRSLTAGLTWRKKAHLRAASYWFSHVSPEADHRDLAQRYREAHYHLVELQEWPIAQQILWMPLGRYPLHRQLWFWGHHHEALELLSPLLSQVGESWQCFLLYEIGQVQTVLGNHEAAHQAFQQQIALAQTLQLPRALVKGYGGLGRLYSYYQAQVPKARHYYQQQLQLARHCQDDLEESLALDGLGRVGFLCGQWRQSTQFYRQAWQLIQTLDEPEMQQSLFLRLEGSCLRWSSVKKHRRPFQHQLEIAQSAGNPLQIWEAAHNLASADAQTQQYEAALASFEVAIAAAKESQNSRNYSISMAAQGACYARMNAWPQAIACTKSAIPGIQQAKDPVAEAICWFNLSYCFSELHQPFQALRCATQIRRLAYQTASGYIWGMFYLAIAYAQWQQRHWIKSLGLAGFGIFYLGWWRSADGRLALAKLFSVLRMIMRQ